MHVPKPPHILVVDDAPEAIRALIVALRSQHWRVTVATGGRQGYERAQLLVPDLILLDVRMPDLDGFTVCRLLRETPVTRHLPVIFLTSAGSREERLDGLTQGGVDYIMKTCEPAELLARIRIHLRLMSRPEPPASAGDEGAASEDEVVLRAAMRLIGDQLAETPSLDQIARKVGTHDKRLSLIFRRHLGMTVFAWIREERLSRSRQLLVDTNLGIQDIAESVGFRSAANFATAFRGNIGVTPSEYRQGIRARS